MKSTQEWRKSFFKEPLVDVDIKDSMKHGVVYFSGRDVSLRPVIIVRAWRIPNEWYQSGSVDKLIKMLVFTMEYFMQFMTIPGRIENLSILVDLKGLGTTQ